MYHKNAVKKKTKCMKCGYWNARDAVYCNLCYEPLAKKEKKEPAPAGPPLLDIPKEEYGPKRLSFVKPLAAAFLFLLAVAGSVYFYKPQLGAGKASAAKLANRYQEKSAAADGLLDACITSREGLLAEIGKGGGAPESFGITGEYTQRLFAIEEKYADDINALGLPCLSCVDKDADTGYLQWAEAHRARENAAMQDFNGKYQALVSRAAGGK